MPGNPKSRGIPGNPETREEHFFGVKQHSDGWCDERKQWVELGAQTTEEECETVRIPLTPFSTFSAFTLMSVADVCMDLRKDDTHKSLKQIFTGDMKIMSNHSGPFMAQKRSAVLHRFPSQIQIQKKCHKHLLNPSPF